MNVCVLVFYYNQSSIYDVLVKRDDNIVRF